jgi:hypothetical protein
MPVEQADEKVHSGACLVQVLACLFAGDGRQLVPQRLRIQPEPVVAVLLEPADRVAEPRRDDLRVVDRITAQAFSEQRGLCRAEPRVGVGVARESRVCACRLEPRVKLVAQPAVALQRGQLDEVQPSAQNLLPLELSFVRPVQQRAPPAEGSGNPRLPADVPLKQAVQRRL